MLTPATVLVAATFGALSVKAQEKPLVDSKTLQDDILIDAVVAHAHALQEFAYSYPERNRKFGGAGHNDSVDYFVETLNALGGYYNVTRQPFTESSYVEGNFTFTEAGAPVEEGAPLQYSPNGVVENVLVPVNALGCTPEDYPAEVAGKVALISRGSCEFGLKSALASSAGAVGAIIYNNVEGNLGSSTLGAPGRPEGDYVPTFGVLQTTGLAWVEATTAGEEITVAFTLEGSDIVESTTENVIAQTVEGDAENVIHLGAHSDSVAAGPGINDNGSGSIALLETAIQLAKYKVNNAVRFSWWSAEEDGLLGSEFYVASLPQEERDKIRLYLNFDMIASPNYVLAAYDGDGSAFNITGPPGSAEAEKLFQDYYESVGSPWTSSEFNGRSDYGPFLEAGIASGGLDTGAEGLKTEEEAAIFGGEAGVAYDVNYHGAGDTVDNLAVHAQEINTKAIAHAVATYATSFDTLPPRTEGNQRVAVSSVQFQYKGDNLIL